MSSYFDASNKSEIDDVLLTLRENNGKSTLNVNHLFNRVKSIIEHHYWYTNEQRKDVTEAALKSRLFTKKQEKAFERKDNVFRDEEENYFYGSSEDDSF